MAGLHQLIPGLAKAENDFQAEQELDLLGVELPIAGLEILPFTSRMFLELEFAGNECLGRARHPSPVALEQFLWRVSASFRRDGGDVEARGSPRRAVVYAVGTSPYLETVDAVHAYLWRAWWLMPQPGTRPLKKGERRPPKSSGTWLSAMLDAVAHEYGWTEDEVLDCPFRRLWQYMHRILERRIPEYAQPNPEALRLKSEWLRAANEGRA